MLISTSEMNHENTISTSLKEVSQGDALNYRNHRFRFSFSRFLLCSLSLMLTFNTCICQKNVYLKFVQVEENHKERSVRALADHVR